jgi:hypothetical protein
MEEAFTRDSIILIAADQNRENHAEERSINPS